MYGLSHVNEGARPAEAVSRQLRFVQDFVHAVTVRPWFRDLRALARVREHPVEPDHERKAA